MTNIKEKINQAKNELGINGAILIADDLGIVIDEKKLAITSLYNPDEQTPSMIWDSKRNMFHDFSTGKNMDYIAYLMEFRNLPFLDAVHNLFDKVGYEYRGNDFKTMDRDDYFNDYKYPVRYNCDRTAVEKYFGNRCISVNTLDYCDITADEDGLVCFNFYDEENKLLLVKNRYPRKLSKGEQKEWCQPNASTTPILFNMNKIDYTIPLLIIEGQADALAVIEAGYKNVVSVPLGAGNLHWIEWNYAWLENFNDIVLWFDNDQAGKKAEEETVSRLGEYRCKVVRPDQSIAVDIESHYSKHGRKGIRKTDANNVLIVCGKGAVMQCINDARDVPNKSIKKLMEYDEIDLKDMPCVSTGYKKLDRIIYGNFKGTLTIVTGSAGKGKSKLVNHMGIVTPIENGEKVFVYSGEASGPVLLSDCLLPLAGPRHTLEWDNGANKPKGYSITNEAKKVIKKFYSESIYLYDDSSSSMLTKADEVLEQMEFAYKKYGVSNFLLDNLMTLNTMSGGSDDEKFASQITFIMKIKKFTNTFPIHVVLVAHPRKPQQGGDGSISSQYEVAGASELVNIADRAFAINVLKDDEEGYDNCINILKDRQLGQAGKRVKMYYDFATKRIYGDDEEKNRVYSWEHEYGDSIVYSDTIKAKIMSNVKGVIDKLYEK